MIKNLTAYRNKWIPKYYWASNNIIFNISSNNDADKCGLQVVDVNKTGDELGQDACEKACGIVMEFSLPSEDTKTLYFPLQYLITDGDRVTSKYFVLRHPLEFTESGFYKGKFLKPIDDEMVSMIVSGKTFDEVFNSLPAWLTTPNNTTGVSISHFIKGTLKTYSEDQYPDGVEIGTVNSVYFYYRDATGDSHRTPINTYDENTVKGFFRLQIALMGIDYINKKLGKQLNSELTDESKGHIQDMGITENTDTTSGALRKFERIVITHKGETPEAMTISSYQAMTASATNEQGNPITVPTTTP